MKTFLGRGHNTYSTPQEFSIEIPDKEADAIHSGTFHPETTRAPKRTATDPVPLQSTKQ